MRCANVCVSLTPPTTSQTPVEKQMPVSVERLLTRTSSRPWQYGTRVMISLDLDTNGIPSATGSLWINQRLVVHIHTYVRAVRTTPRTGTGEIYLVDQHDLRVRQRTRCSKSVHRDVCGRDKAPLKNHERVRR